MTTLGQALPPMHTKTKQCCPIQFWIHKLWMEQSGSQSGGFYEEGIMKVKKCIMLYIKGDQKKITDEILFSLYLKFRWSDLQNFGISPHNKGCCIKNLLFEILFSWFLCSNNLGSYKFLSLPPIFMWGTDKNF